MNLDDLKADPDPVVVELATSVERYRAQLAAGEISRDAHDELCRQALDVKAIAARAGREETDQVIRAAVQALAKIAGVAL